MDKWTVHTIFHFVHVAIFNAWIGYHQDENKKGTPQKDILQQMNFQLEVAQTYLAAAEECEESDAEGDQRAMHLPAIDDVLYHSLHLHYIGRELSICQT